MPVNSPDSNPVLAALTGVFTLWAAVLLVTLSLSLPTRADNPQYGGSVVVAISTDPGGLNPAITSQGGVQTICGSIFSGLVNHNFDLEPVPDLALSWEVSPDGRVYTFYLAPNAVFHDGKPVTSADVKFTFDDVLMKYHSRTRASIGNNLKQITMPDEHTVVFEFDRPYAAFLALVDSTNTPILPAHIYKDTDPLTNPANVKPIGSGPFKFEEWVKGDHISLIRNESYFKTGKPYLDRVVYKVTPSAATASIAFETGEVDYFLNPSALDYERINKLENVVVTDKGREGFATVETIVLNNSRGPLSDVRVRRALAYVVDKDYIVDKIAFGRAKPATGPISSLLKWAYNPDVEKYSRNLDEANRLLDEAGLMRDPSGERFQLNAVYPASYAKIIEALRDQFREVGVILNLNQMEFSAAVDMVYVKKDFDIGFASFENGPDPDIGVKRTLVSANIGPIPFSNGAIYRNSRMDELFSLAAAEMDKQRRAALYFEAQQIALNDVPYLWLHEPLSGTAYDAGLNGMYTWNAKSNVYFAQDAWWSNPARSDRLKTQTSRRQTYFFVAAAALTAVLLLFLLRRRRMKRSSK